MPRFCDGTGARQKRAHHTGRIHWRTPVALFRQRLAISTSDYSKYPVLSKQENACGSMVYYICKRSLPGGAERKRRWKWPAGVIGATFRVSAHG